MLPLKAAAYYSDRKNGFNQLCRYYLAEAYFRDGKYQEAREILTDLYNLYALPRRTEGSLITYQLAYTFFKEADYERALKWFNSYLSGAVRTQGADAATRVGDCYFFGGDYAAAVKAWPCWKAPPWPAPRLRTTEMPCMSWAAAMWPSRTRMRP